jgi:hypothetical protein
MNISHLVKQSFTTTLIVMQFRHECGSNLTCVLPFPTLTPIFTMHHIRMYAESMIRPTKPSCTSLVFHKVPITHVRVGVHPKHSTFVKYLSILQAYLPRIQSEKLIIKWCMTMLQNLCLHCNQKVIKLHSLAGTVVTLTIAHDTAITQNSKHSSYLSIVTLLSVHVIHML